jgi:hypothetical protein
VRISRIAAFGAGDGDALGDAVAATPDVALEVGALVEIAVSTADGDAVASVLVDGAPAHDAAMRAKHVSRAIVPTGAEYLSAISAGQCQEWRLPLSVREELTSSTTT